LAKEKLTTEEIKNKLLLDKDKDGRAAWHYAAKWRISELLEKLWECAEEDQRREEKRYKLFVGKDRDGRTAWQSAAERGNSEILKNYGSRLKRI